MLIDSMFKSSSRLEHFCKERIPLCAYFHFHNRVESYIPTIHQGNLNLIIYWKKIKNIFPFPQGKRIHNEFSIIIIFLSTLASCYLTNTPLNKNMPKSQQLDQSLDSEHLEHWPPINWTWVPSHCYWTLIVH